MEDIFNILKLAGLVTTQYAYSVEWLGMSKSYYSLIKSSGREPSISVLLHLMTRIQDTYRTILLSSERLDESHGYADWNINRCGRVHFLLRDAAPVIERELLRLTNNALSDQILKWQNERMEIALHSILKSQI